MRQKILDVCVLAHTLTDNSEKSIQEDQCSYSKTNNTSLAVDGLNLNNHLLKHFFLEYKNHEST
jgi:hypothetical protein